jgi:holo-[acyl-carrier protein] synthase
MKIHCGVDIVKVSRIIELLKDPTSVQRTFSQEEIRNKPESLAGIFALKEAFFKATQIKIKNWRDVIIKYDKAGKPYIVYDENSVSLKISSIDCSISHDGEYVIATVVLLED